MAYLFYGNLSYTPSQNIKKYNRAKTEKKRHNYDVGDTYAWHMLNTCRLYSLTMVVSKKREASNIDSAYSR